MRYCPAELQTAPRHLPCLPTRLQGYQRPELWDGRAYRHLSASGHSMPATWSLLPADVCPPGSSNSAATNALAVATNGQAGARGSAGHSPQQQSQEDQQQLWVHMPEGSYRWEEVAACPAYVRCVLLPPKQW